MTSERFDALLKQRDEKQREHELACAVLEEEPSPWQHKKCSRLYDELADLQQQIDAAIAEERAQ